MTTLHRVAEISKKIIIGFSIGIGSIIFFAVLVKIFGNIKESIFPTPPPPPTVRYGKLPSIPFSQSKTDKNLTYNLNTLSGSLPTLPAQIEVYRISQPQPNLLNFDNVKTLVAKNNFISEPIAISDRKFMWKNDDPVPKTLTFDTLTSDFEINSNYLTNQDVLNAAALPSSQDAITFAKNYIAAFDSFPSDIDETKTITQLMSIKNGQVSKATSFSNAQLILVNFFQKDINKLHIFYPNFPTSSINVTVASGATGPQVVEAQFFHKIILTEDNSTYPLKSVTNAYEELKNNKAYIANFESDNTKIDIKDVWLGYFSGTKEQLFLYPVFVFLGDNNFYAFVSAVKNEWIKN